MLPPTVTLEVADTAAPIRGGSDATWKPASLDTGWKRWSGSSSPLAKKSASTRLNANMLDGKARERNKGVGHHEPLTLCSKRRRTTSTRNDV
jgi:hypothetical protein